MFKKMFFGSVAMVAATASCVWAAPKDDVQAAAQKLADSASYSWTTTTEGGQGGGNSDGKTEKGGYTQYTLTMRNTSYTVVLKDKTVAIKTDDGWHSLSDLTADAQPGPQRYLGMIVSTFKAPADQAKEQVDKLGDVQKTDDAYTADLSPEAAKTLMTFRGRAGGTPPEVSNAKASVKMWLTDGVLSKYQLHVQGTVSFNGNDRDIDRTTTVEIKDIGVTKVDVPDEAKAKLAPITTQPAA